MLTSTRSRTRYKNIIPWTFTWNCLYIWVGLNVLVDCKVVNNTYVLFFWYVDAQAEKIQQNPLVFWKDMEGIYPILAPIARKYLTVVATSVPSERLFSKVGNIITEKRNRLKGETAAKLAFLESVDESVWIDF